MFNSQKDEFFNDLPSEIKSESKYLTKFFLSFALSYFVMYVIVIFGLSYISRLNYSDKVHNIIGLGFQQLMMLLIYFLTKAFTRNLQYTKHPVMDKMTFFKFATILVASIFILAIGSLISTYFVSLVSKLTGHVPLNFVEQTVTQMSITEIFIFVVIMAAIIEELVFRKLIIDALSKYGTAFCVVVSGFIFGIVHANFYQFFYAFGLGVLMGYVYCIYGKIIYTILIHGAINTLGSIVPLVVGLHSTQTVTPIQIAYVYVYLALVICGGIIAFRNFKKLKLYSVGGVLISPARSLYKSWGFAICIAFFATEFIYNTISFV
ncbi:MAG: CPBP family intramembrane metalloprotease [Clostridia bacterium]|nr:CPBP family intramembrane metalloprotease [Clostridia bacterium]